MLTGQGEQEMAFLSLKFDKQTQKLAYYDCTYAATHESEQTDNGHN